MNKEDFNHSKITKIEPYQNADGRWLFNLTYELWDDDGNKAELNIPCVESPFYDSTDVITVYKEYCEEIEIRDGLNNIVQKAKYGQTYKANIKTIDMVNIYMTDDNNTSEQFLYKIKFIKKVMTVDDIEKALGYEVKIVNEESKKENKRNKKKSTS